MNPIDLRASSSAILKKAEELGATLAGFALVEDLKAAPSFTFAPQMPGAGEGVGARENELGLKPGQVAWPEGACSLLIIAVEHPEDKPEMDWWFGRVDPPGNRILARIVRELVNGSRPPTRSERFICPTISKKEGLTSKIPPCWQGWGVSVKTTC